MKKLITILFTLHASLLTFHAVEAQQKSTWDNIPDDIRNRRAFQRFEWFYQQRAFPFDTLPVNLFEQVKAAEIGKIKSNRSQGTEYLQWDCIGPSGVQPMTTFQHWGITSGRVRAVAVHPADPETVYIGAACGGIWKTTDGGENWIDIGGGLESLSFGAIAIDPVNPDIIYAGSGEASYLTAFTMFNGKGLLKSADGGQSWSIITDGFGSMTHFSDIAVCPNNSNIVFATIASGNYFAGDSLSNEGIWKSTNAGISWIRKLDQQDGYDISFHPTDPSIIYAAFGGMNDNSGFYISSDQGETWTQRNSGLQPANTISRMHFDISLSNPDFIYCVIYQAGTGAFWSGTTRAYKSLDGGITWFQISTGINLGGYVGFWADQGFYDLCIAVDPADHEHVFIGNIELHETIDGSVFSPVRPFGNTANGSLVHNDYHKFAFAPSDPAYLYIGCDGGLYKSTDNGQTATSQNAGLKTLQFYRIASHPSNPGIVIGGMQDNGNAITFDPETSWQQTTPGDGMECFFDYTDPNIVYASVQNGWLTKSTDGGLTFPSWIKNVAGAWITPFYMHPTDHLTLYSANKSILRSTNSGSSWVTIAQDVAPVNISTMAQSKVNPNHMIFATGGGDSPAPDTTIIVKISTDEGFYWTDVTANIPGVIRWISRVVTDPQEANTMYILRTGFSPGNKVWKTTDLGQTWTNISGNLPDLPCNDLFIDPEYNGHLYVANDIGIYLSTDGGITWNYASDGIPFVPVLDFDYVKIGDIKYLRAGTHGRSIYETAIIVGTYEITSSELIHFLYPNPTSGQVVVKYFLPEPRQVSLKIHDITGREIETLVSAVLEKGEHTCKLNTANLQSGIYLIKLTIFCELPAVNCQLQTVTEKLLVKH